MTTTKPSKRTRTPRRALPQFASPQEEAAFWDSHDLTDFAGEWEPVTFRRAPDFSHALVVDLPNEALDALTEHARRQGVGSAALARTWLLGRLRAG